MHLLKAMQKYGTGFIVFSPTAAVYGEPRLVPIDEKHPLEPTNPYIVFSYVPAKPFMVNFI